MGGRVEGVVFFRDTRSSRRRRVLRVYGYVRLRFRAALSRCDVAVAVGAVVVVDVDVGAVAVGDFCHVKVFP